MEAGDPDKSKEAEDEERSTETMDERTTQHTIGHYDDQVEFEITRSCELLRDKRELQIAGELLDICETAYVLDDLQAEPESAHQLGQSPAYMGLFHRETPD